MRRRLFRKRNVEDYVLRPMNEPPANSEDRNMVSHQGLLSLLLWEDFDLSSPNLDLDIQARLLHVISSFITCSPWHIVYLRTYAPADY